MQAVFSPHAERDSYERAVASFIDHPASHAVPVLVWNRPDLVDRIRQSEPFFERPGSTTRFRSTRVLSRSELPAGLKALIGAADRASSKADPWTTHVGLYEDIVFGDTVMAARPGSRGSKKPDSVVFGRDASSLSWALAKQFARLLPGGETLVVTDADQGEPIGSCTWIGPTDIAAGTARDKLLQGRWRRLLLHGNGQDDSLNLGSFTICGLRPGTDHTSNPFGPSCRFGQGCYKPEAGIIPVAQLKCTELALVNCFSGPSAGLATYPPDYQLVLEAIDGSAQTILFTTTACDASRPELQTWLEGAPNIAATMNDSVVDVNPFTPFIQFGIPVPPLNTGALR